MNEIHRKACPNAPNGPLPTQASCDGVSECRSNSVTLDVYSTRMLGCKQVYPHRIVRPLTKTYKDPQNHLAIFLASLKDNGYKLKHFIADNPKRALARFCLNHASLYPCEYCFARGTKYTPPSGQNEGKKRSKTVWPANSVNAEPRTTQKILEIIEKIDQNPFLSKEEKKGIIGRSPLLDVPDYDFVRDSPTEYMHAVCIGVVKRLLELTFDIGEKRARITKRALSSTTLFDICMSNTKVTRECSRRARKLDLAVMKAQEYRNILILFFPHVLQCLEGNAKERKLWLLLVFMIRSCILPSEEQINLDDIAEASHEFYELYERLFGCDNCTYNTHIVCAHLIEMRAHGPLTLTSAFGFEAFYGEMRHAFTAGTQSPLKQIFQKVLLKRVISHHCCENSIYFSARDSPLECNSLIYVYKNGDHQMYKIQKVNKDTLLCYPQGKYDYTFRECSKYNWSSIGVYKKGGIRQTPITIPKNIVAGKVLIVGDFLITCPNNILREK